MELDQYLESVRRSVENATALADDQTRSVAQRLGATLDDAGRLALISALSDAAGEISRELSPGSVELRMAGGRPEFVVTPAPSQLTGNDDDDLDDEVAEPAAAELALDADEPTARITLRLPMSVKNKVDEAATAEGISSNAWLMRTVMTALTGRGAGGYGRPPRPPRPPRPGIFAPDGPLGPEGPLGPDGIFGQGGVFGPEGVFGPDGLFGEGRRGGDRGDRRNDRNDRRERGDHGQRRGGRGPGQRMQGWAQ